MKLDEYSRGSHSYVNLWTLTTRGISILCMKFRKKCRNIKAKRHRQIPVESKRFLCEAVAV